MTSRRVVLEILNELLRQERASLVAHLLDSTLFVSWASAEEDLAARRMVRQVEEHKRWLVDAIVSLKGGIEPGALDIRAAELHYQALHHALTAIIESEKRVIVRYEAALKHLSGEPQVSAVVSRILARHREHVQQLSGFLASRTTTPSGSASA